MPLLLRHHQLVAVRHHGVHVHQPIPELLVLRLKLLQTGKRRRPSSVIAKEPNSTSTSAIHGVSSFTLPIVSAQRLETCGQVLTACNVSSWLLWPLNSSLLEILSSFFMVVFFFYVYFMWRSVHDFQPGDFPSNNSAVRPPSTNATNVIIWCLVTSGFILIVLTRVVKRALNPLPDPGATQTLPNVFFFLSLFWNDAPPFQPTSLFQPLPPPPTSPICLHPPQPFPSPSPLSSNLLLLLDTGSHQIFMRLEQGPRLLKHTHYCQPFC